jgi:hypothetical protein
MFGYVSTEEPFVKSSKTLGIVVVLQAVLMAGLWLTSGSSKAQADVPVSNPSERQLAMLDELRNLNSKLDQLNKLLSDGRLEVKVTRVDIKR